MDEAAPPMPSQSSQCAAEHELPVQVPHDIQGQPGKETIAHGNSAILCNKGDAGNRKFVNLQTFCDAIS